MTLVDTSVWIGHFRSENPVLGALLAAGQVMTHPYIIGEIACGDLRNRALILADLQALPSVVTPTDDDVMALLEKRKLWGSGLGWIDVNLLASALLSRCRLWTLDRALERVAGGIGLPA